MNWKFLRLELDSTGEFPGGSVSRAYLIRLPLDDSDKIDAPAFESAPHRATYRRHWSTEPDERGQVIRHNGGWIMKSDAHLRTLELNSHPIRLGERVSVRDDNGAILPFKIASIR